MGFPETVTTTPIRLNLRNVTTLGACKGGGRRCKGNRRTYNGGDSSQSTLRSPQGTLRGPQSACAPAYKRAATSWVVAILILAGAMNAYAGEPEFDLSVPDETVQGSPFRVTLQISGDSAESVDFYLVDSDGETHSNVPGAAFRTDSGDRVWANLLGTASTASTGDWRVRARVHFTRYAVEIEEAFSITEGDFFSMTISLDRELTSLLTDPDPRRQEERRELNRLLASADPEAVYNPGTFVMPVVDYNRTSAGFGDRRIYEYYDGSTSRSVHQGIDYAAPTGTDTLAAGHGVVRLAADRMVSGKSVVIEHMPGVFSLYYHLDSLSVEEGDFVMAGDRIGTIGATGLATGAHLHWEIRIGGVAVDPEWFLSSAAVDTHELLTTLSP